MSGFQGSHEPGAGPIEVSGRNIGRARGYSLLELERAGLTRENAERLGIAVDAERISGVGSNVMQLRNLVRRA